MSIQHYHLLIVNPTEMALRLVKSGIDNKSPGEFNIAVVVTPDYQATLPSNEEFESKYNARLFDLRVDEWDNDLKFTSAIAYNLLGQSFLEAKQSQILLNNLEFSDMRLSSYYKDKPVRGDFIVEVISYNGRHVVVQCLKFEEGVTIENKFDNNWSDIVENAFAYLDNHKVINGPSQIYFNNRLETIGLRLHPCNVAYVDQLKGTSRHWWDILPTVTMLQKDKPNIAFRRFYEWTEKTGHSSKLYSTGSEGQLVLKA